MNGEYTARVLPVISATAPVERLSSLFDVHHDRLYRLARRLASSSDDARDLVQETFLKAAQFPKSIPIGATNEEAWLVRVLTNIRRDQWRKQSIRDHHDRAGFGSGHPPIDERNLEAMLIAKRTVWEALNVLPPRRRAIVVMHELEGLAIPKIAKLLGITSITVRWHLSKGKRDLAGALKGYVGDTNENS